MVKDKWEKVVFKNLIKKPLFWILMIMLIVILILNKIPVQQEKVCKMWNENSNIVYPLENDDITKEQWVKCCIQRVQENGVIKECKYIKLSNIYYYNNSR